MPRRRVPECGRTFDGSVCAERGEHLCLPRVAHVVAFFAEILVHTKGRWARTPFRLADWQREEIITPLFGTVVWSEEHRCYVRRYRIAWIELARKNGKSELLAGIALYLLVADGEEGAEVYGAALDKDQARKVYDVAKRMRDLSPELAPRVRPYEQTKRMVHHDSASYYEIVAADAAGNLGHNPHGIVFDEILTQKTGDLWHSLRTGMGARLEPLMVAATTAGDDPSSWAKHQHDEMVRIAQDPDRAPHVFVYARNMPADADPFDEANWHLPNPALGSFLSIESLRQEAAEAKADPLKENAFRQFRCNQWVSQSTRWMPMHLWDDCTGQLWLNPQWGYDKLAGRTAYAGFDLSAKFDLTAWCALLAPLTPDGEVEALWRFWIPEEGLDKLDALHDGRFTQWARQGWLTVTEGAVIDYDRVVADIAADAAHLRIAAVDCDEWSMWPVITRIADACGLDVDAGEVTAYKNTYDRMSGGMDDLMGMVRNGRLRHHGNPLARFCFDACEVRHAPYDPNLVRPVKPERGTSRVRIDAVPAAAMAANALRRAETMQAPRSAYEDDGLMVV